MDMNLVEVEAVIVTIFVKDNAYPLLPVLEVLERLTFNIDPTLNRRYGPINSA
jgi:hypothetical protein